MPHDVRVCFYHYDTPFFRSRIAVDILHNGKYYRTRSYFNVQTATADFLMSRLERNGICLRIFTARALLSRYMQWPCVCLCVSVCPCVTSRCSTKTAKLRMTQTTPQTTPRDSFSDTKNLFKIRTWVPNAGGVGRSWRISTNNSINSKMVQGRQTYGFY